MPKVSRRNKSKSSSKSASTLIYWKRVVLISLPVVAAIFFVNQSQGSVLGINDFMGKKANVSTSPKPTGVCKPIKIDSITFSSPCENKPGFQKVVYSCGDGTSSTISSIKCGNPQELFEKVKKACNKNSICRPNISKMPKPTSAVDAEGQNESESQGQGRGGQQ